MPEAFEEQLDNLAESVHETDEKDDIELLNRAIFFVRHINSVTEVRNYFIDHVNQANLVSYGYWYETLTSSTSRDIVQAWENDDSQFKSRSASGGVKDFVAWAHSQLDNIYDKGILKKIQIIFYESGEFCEVSSPRKPIYSPAGDRPVSIIKVMLATIGGAKTSTQIYRTLNKDDEMVGPNTKAPAWISDTIRTTNEAFLKATKQKLLLNDQNGIGYYLNPAFEIIKPGEDFTV